MSETKLRFWCSAWAAASGGSDFKNRTWPFATRPSLGPGHVGPRHFGPGHFGPGHLSPISAPDILDAAIWDPRTRPFGPSHNWTPAVWGPWYPCRQWTKLLGYSQNFGLGPNLGLGAKLYPGLNAWARPGLPGQENIWDWGPCWGPALVFGHRDHLGLEPFVSLGRRSYQVQPTDLRSRPKVWRSLTYSCNHSWTRKRMHKRIVQLSR
jgi:hypothetical protein